MLKIIHNTCGFKQYFLRCELDHILNYSTPPRGRGCEYLNDMRSRDCIPGLRVQPVDKLGVTNSAYSISALSSR